MSDGVSSLEKSIAIIPKVGGALSLIACSLIMRDVSIKWHGKKSVSLTSVIVFCISVADWFYSLFAAFLSTWMAPADSGAYLASGTTQTCTAQGFIADIAIGASMSYYAVLMILYWLIVSHGWTESRMKNLSIRLSFILTPIIIALVSSIPPLFFGMYNPSGAYSCSLAAMPFYCEGTQGVECIRGQGARALQESSMIYIMVCNVIVIISVSLLIYKVFKQESKTDKYLAKGQEKRRENTIKTSWQGIRYIGAFVLAYFTLYVFYGYQLAGQTPPASVMYLHIILTPLLGLFNSFVYFRPRYITYRDNNPSASRVTCMGNVFNVDVDYIQASLAKYGDGDGACGLDEGDDLESPLFRCSD